MKKNVCILLILCILFSCFASSSFAAETEPEEHICGDYEYTILNDGTACIGLYYGNEEILEVPSKLDSRVVTGIDNLAFSTCKSLTEVTLPDSITFVGFNPFAGCKSLKNIHVSPNHSYLATIDGVLFSKPEKRLIFYPITKTDSIYKVPDGIVSIDNRAFESCENLTEINLPDSTSSIGDLAFSSCENLTEINLPDSISSVGTAPFSSCTSLYNILVSPNHSYLAMIDGVLFSKPNKQLICYPITKTDSSYKVPDGIASIGDRAFCHCNNLTEISLPDSITSICFGAFEFCDNLTEINLPESLTSIGNCAFLACSNLTEINLPESLTSIGLWAFEGCDNITFTVFPESFAEKYALENGIPRKYPESTDLSWLNS